MEKLIRSNFKFQMKSKRQEDKAFRLLKSNNSKTIPGLYCIEKSIPGGNGLKQKLTKRNYNREK